MPEAKEAKISSDGEKVVTTILGRAPHVEELRDYFAAHAPLGPIDWRDITTFTKYAYRWADAMLAERGRTSR